MEIEKELVEKFGKDSEIIIADIGAFDGMSTVAYLSLFPKAKSILFEARKDNCKLCRQNMEKAGIENRTLVINAVLGKFNKKASFYNSKGHTKRSKDQWSYSSSIYPPKVHLRLYPWCKFDKETVDIIPLKSVYDGKIDFIHIDVQGAELMVFEGMINDMNGARMVWMEVSNTELYAGQPTRIQVEKYMTDKGFELIKNTCVPGVSQGDQLWSR
jgi:FkbM family methyltransferase